MKLWSLHSAAIAVATSDQLEINAPTTPATTTSTIQIVTTPTTLDSSDKNVRHWEGYETEFYVYGLSDLSWDWKKILRESEDKSSITRLDTKFQKIITKLKEQKAAYKADDKVKYPYMDGTIYPHASKGWWDASIPCDAIDSLADALKRWTMNFIGGALKPCSRNSCYSPPFGALRGLEVNKKWHKRNLQIVKQTMQRIERLVTKFKNASECKYCIVITSSEHEDLCYHHSASVSAWAGDDMKFLVNGEVVRTIPGGFTKFEYCPSWDEVDVENDRFQIQSTSTDGVCITGITMNGKEMLVGKLNDKPSFWIDGNQQDCMDDHMATPQITFKNGEVLSSYCKGIFRNFYSRSGPSRIKIIHIERTIQYTVYCK